MTVPRGFSLTVHHLKSEPADFYSCRTRSLSSLPLLFSWQMLNKSPGAPKAICLLQPPWPPRTPPDGSHSGCLLKSSQLPSPSTHGKAFLALQASASNTWGLNLLKRLFFFGYYSQWANRWAGHRQESWPLCLSWHISFSLLYCIL